MRVVNAGQVLFPLQACISLRAFGFDGNVRVRRLAAAAARHRDSEGICVLQLHPVFLGHFDERTPSESVTETCTKPKKRGGWGRNMF